MYFYVTIILYAMSTNTNNIGIGVRALDTNTGGSYTIGIGTNSLTDKGSGSYNTAIGAESGATDTNTSYNTFLGANTDIATTTAPTNSTAIGYNAKINESNQIVMGTASEYVCIPGQLSIGKVNVNISDSRKPATGIGLDISGDIVSTGKLLVSNDISGNGSLRIANNIFSNGTLFVAGDISGNSNLKIKDISANALTLGGRLVAAEIDVNKVKVIDVSGTNLSLSNKLFVDNDISCNGNLKVKDISGNGMKLTDNLVVEGNISTSQNISGNGLTINGMINSGAITTPGMIKGGAITSTTTIDASGIITGVGVNAGGAITGATTINASGLITGAGISAGGPITNATTINASGLITGVGVNAGSGPITTLTTIDASGAITAGGIIKGVGVHAGGGPITNATTINASGLITGVGVNAGGAISGATNITATGAISGVTTINASGLITGAGISAGGPITNATTINASGLITGVGVNAGGAITGATTINASGAITGATTINASGAITAGGQITGVGLNAGGAITGATTITSSGLITGVGVNAGGAISNATTITANGIITGAGITAGDISGNNLKIKDVSANIVTINKLFVGTTEITSNGSTADGSNNTILGGFGKTIMSSIRTGANAFNSTAVGYAAIIDSSNQIVLGTSGEFVCIPSNNGLSVGKNSKPTSMLDVSGSSIVSGDLTIRGTYYGDSSNNVKIGGVKNKTNGGIDGYINKINYSTNPTINVNLLIDNITGSISLENIGSPIYTNGIILTSSTGFNNIINTTNPLGAPPFNLLENNTTSIGSVNFYSNPSSNTFLNAYLSVQPGLTFHYGITSNNYNYGIIEYYDKAGWGLATGTTNFGSSLYKASIINSQNISLYISLGSSAFGNINPAIGGNNYIYMTLTGGATWVFQKVTTITITPPTPTIIPRNSTYLGANIKYLSDIDTSTSTAIGYGANIDVSNQIVIGTSGEFVCIPSNRGLSIGKSTEPGSIIFEPVTGFDPVPIKIPFPLGIDVSGSLYINGDIYVRGRYLNEMDIATAAAFNPTYSAEWIEERQNSTSVRLGQNSLKANPVSLGNVAIGGGTLSKIIEGYGNTAVGSLTLEKNLKSKNTALGFKSLQYDKTGENNTALGSQAGLRYNLNDVLLSEAEIIQRGESCDTSGNLTFLVSNTGIFSFVNSNITNSTAIGYGTKLDASNQIVLGTPNTYVAITNSLSIGKNIVFGRKPLSSLDITGNLSVTNDTLKNNVITTNGSNTFTSGIGGNKIIATNGGGNTIQASANGPNLITSSSGSIEMTTGGNGQPSCMLLQVTGAAGGGGITLQTDGSNVNSRININSKSSINHYINSNEKLSHVSDLTKITNPNVDVIGILGATSYRIGTKTASLPLMNSFTFTSPQLTTNAAINLGINGSQSTFMQFPMSTTIHYIFFSSSPTTQNTAQTITWRIDLGSGAVVTNGATGFPSGASGVSSTFSYTLPAPYNLAANTNFYMVMTPNVASTPAKSWQATIFYSQR